MLLFFPHLSLMFYSVLVYFKLLNVITLCTLVLLRLLGGIIFVVFVWLIYVTLFYPLSLCDKKNE
jgi:hypothetical protein